LYVRSSHSFTQLPNLTSIFWSLLINQSTGGVSVRQEPTIAHVKFKRRYDAESALKSGAKPLGASLGVPLTFSWVMAASGGASSSSPSPSGRGLATQTSAAPGSAGSAGSGGSASSSSAAAAAAGRRNRRGGDDDEDDEDGDDILYDD
jgi:hypothetical protein